MERKKFKKGDLVKVSHQQNKKWIVNFGIIVSVKPTLQVAKVYVQGTGKFLPRVHFRFIEHTNKD